MTTIWPANHWLFQLAQIALLFSYLTWDILHLRFLLALAALLFVLWGGIILDISIDTTVWNIVFFLINVWKTIQILNSRRPIKLERPEHEQLYEGVFAKLGVSRSAFKSLVEQSFIRTLKSGSAFVTAGNEVHTLSFVLEGSFNVLIRDEYTQELKVLHLTQAGEFLESPQYVARYYAHKWDSTPIKMQDTKQLKTRIFSCFMTALKIMGLWRQHPPTHQALADESAVDTSMSGMGKVQRISVSLEAATDCKFIQWPLEALAKVLDREPDLKSPLNTIVAADVALKLFHQTKGTSPSQKQNHFGMRSESKKLAIDRLSQMMVDQVQLPCTLKDLEALVEHGYIRQYEREGTIVIRQGEPVYVLALVLQGTLDGFSESTSLEEKESIVLPKISENEFIGSLEFMDHKRDLDQISKDSLVSLRSFDASSSLSLPPPVYNVSHSLAQLSIRAKGACELLVWNSEDLEILFRDCPGTRRVLNTLIAYDVTQKFQTLRSFSFPNLQISKSIMPKKQTTKQSKKKKHSTTTNAIEEQSNVEIHANDSTTKATRKFKKQNGNT